MMKKIITIIFAIITSVSYSQQKNDKVYKWGFIDSNGKEITPLKYDEVNFFENGLAKVKINNRWGLINSLGIEILDPKYEYIGGWIDFKGDKLFKVELNDKWGLVGTANNEVGEIKYQWIKPLRNYPRVVGFAFKLNDKWGVTNQITGDCVSKYDDLRYDDVTMNLFANIEGKWGIVNYEGDEIVPIIYENIQNIGHRTYKSHLYTVQINGKWGLINDKNQFIIPAEYKLISYDKYDSKLIVAYLENDEIRFDKEGKEVSRKVLKEKVDFSYYPRFEDFSRSYDCSQADNYFFNCFSNRIYYHIYCPESEESEESIFLRDQNKIVEKDHKWSIVNENHKEINPIKYDEIENLEQTELPCYLKVKIGDKWGLINYMNKEITPIKYNEIENFNEGFAAVKILIE